MSESKLKRCPFCGGEAGFGTIHYRANGWEQDLFHYVNCISCGADNKGLVGHDTFGKATTAWNRRWSESEKPGEDYAELRRFAELGHPWDDLARLLAEHDGQAGAIQALREELEHELEQEKLSRASVEQSMAIVAKDNESKREWRILAQSRGAEVDRLSGEMESWQREAALSQRDRIKVEGDYLRLLKAAESESERLRGELERVTAGYHRRKDELDEQYAQIQAAEQRASEAETKLLEDTDAHKFGWEPVVDFLSGEGFLVNTYEETLPALKELLKLRRRVLSEAQGKLAAVQAEVKHVHKYATHRRSCDTRTGENMGYCTCGLDDGPKVAQPPAAEPERKGCEVCGGTKLVSSGHGWHPCSCAPYSHAEPAPAQQESRELAGHAFVPCSWPGGHDGDRTASAQKLRLMDCHRYMDGQFCGRPESEHPAPEQAKAVHYGSNRQAECGEDTERLSMEPAQVTCPTCRGWLPIVAPRAAQPEEKR